MPSTFSMRLDSVDIVELLELLVMVFVRLNRLSASVTSCSLLLLICVSMVTLLLFDDESVSCESLISHVPLTVLEFTSALNEPSEENVSVTDPSVMPYFSSCVCNVLSILLDATLPVADVSTLSDSKTMAGSVYTHVPTIFFVVAVLLLENIEDMLDRRLLDDDESSSSSSLDDERMDDSDDDVFDDDDDDFFDDFDDDDDDDELLLFSLLATFSILTCALVVAGTARMITANASLISCFFIVIIV